MIDHVLKWALLPAHSCTESFVADDTALMNQTGLPWGYLGPLGAVSFISFLKDFYFEIIIESQEVAKIVQSPKCPSPSF